MSPLYSEKEREVRGMKLLNKTEMGAVLEG